MNPATHTLRRSHALWLAALAAMLVAALAWLGPIGQPDGYHGFADARAWLGIENAANVLSNLPLALVGLGGAIALRRSPGDPAARGPWWLLCIALVATAAGSSLYHGAPHNDTLVLDRIPIAWACSAVLAAFFAERGWRFAGHTGTLAAMVVTATAAVLYWWWTERLGQGDLRPYLVFQGLPMALIPAALLLRLPRSHAGAAPDSAWWALVLFYAGAKAAESADPLVLDALGFVSGHTLKHLLAAAGAAWLLRGATTATSGSRR